MTTATEYVSRLKQRGQKISDVPQPYGRSVAELIRSTDDHAIAATLAHLLAHALHDMDVALGKA